MRQKGCESRPKGKEGAAAITGETESRVERRNAIRYRMGVPANYRWSGRDKKRNLGAGTVRDMSLEGIFILSPACPPVGAKVDIEIGRLGQKERRRQGQRRFVKAGMRVVRVERNEGATGFAASGKVFIGGGRPRRGSLGNASASSIVKDPRNGQRLTTSVDYISAQLPMVLAFMSTRKRA